MNNKQGVPDERRYKIGERLRTFRISKGLTQEQMSEKLGVSKTFYGQVERGISNLGLSKLLILSDEFDADIGYILTGKKYYHLTGLFSEHAIPHNRLDSIQRILEELINMP